MRHIALIGAQVAASCVLLIVAGLLVRALNQASGNPGFEYQQVITSRPGLGRSRLFMPAKQARAYLRAAAGPRLRDVPGVDSVSLASIPPFGNKTVTMGLTVGGRNIGMHPNSIDAQYFQTMKIPLLRGRSA